MPLHAELDIILPIPSVCLSHCLSNSGAMCKLMDISSQFFDILVGAPFHRWKGTPQRGR